MTNAQIIFNESQKLAEAGKIGYTGREFVMETADGQKVNIKETEAIHTFSAWKELGYKVKKGEHAVAKFVIWKYSTPKQETLMMKDGEDVSYLDKGRMFMRMSAFFSASQVEPLPEA